MSPADDSGAALPDRRSIRPRDAASILLLDRSETTLRVLMGRRSSAHVFMPDVHVFPGGRRDPGDHRLAATGDLHPAVLERLRAAHGGRATESRLRAIALAGLRELYEETGVAVGLPAPLRNRALPFLPDLRNLRYMARAITPPGHIRRFDTHFFALFIDEAGIDPKDGRDSRELQDLRWIDVNDVSSVRIPDITGAILRELNAHLRLDAALTFGAPVPFFHTLRGRPVRDVL